jgi:hypothetical protein
MMSQAEFVQADDATQRAELIAVLTAVASGTAPSLALRTCALRALRNEPVSGPLSKIVATDEERFELAVMAECAERELRRH